MTGLHTLFLRGRARVTLYSLMYRWAFKHVFFLLYPAWLDRREGKRGVSYHVASKTTLSLNVYTSAQEGGHLPAHPSSDVREGILESYQPAWNIPDIIHLDKGMGRVLATPRTYIGQYLCVDLKVVRHRAAGLT